MNLSFGNFNSATTNGSELGTYGVGANQSLSGGGMGMAPKTGMGVPNVSVAAPTTPQVGANAQQGGGFFSEGGGASMVLGGVQVLGNLWNSYQSHKLAKEQMGFAREQWDTNLKNQTQTYNTSLEDRIRARHATEGKGEAQTDKYLSKHSL